MHETQYTVSLEAQRLIADCAHKNIDLFCDPWEQRNIRLWRRALRAGENLPEFQLWYMSFTGFILQQLDKLPKDLNILEPVKSKKPKRIIKIKRR